MKLSCIICIFRETHNRLVVLVGISESFRDTLGSRGVPVHVLNHFKSMNNRELFLQIRPFWELPLGELDLVRVRDRVEVAGHQ